LRCAPREKREVGANRRPERLLGKAHPRVLVRGSPDTPAAI
jgi:hypothetical protein